MSPGISDAELRKVYRRLVKQHHPDHNGGSAESERRFEEIQEAYAQIGRVRASQPGRRPDPAAAPDPGVEARLAELERELREAQRLRAQAQAAEREARIARDRAARAAREASASEDLRKRPSDEELGYFSTDDSLTKILTDAREELSDRFERVREHPVARRVSDLIDELEDLASRTDRKRPTDKQP